MNLESLLTELDQLVDQLSLPLSRALADDGWDGESAAMISQQLNALRSQIEMRGEIPPMAERPLNMVRTLDHWGVQRGDLIEELASLEGRLRRSP
jgi:hypothetical protein